MSEEKSGGCTNGCGCGGCITLVIFILMVTAIGWGLPINDKKWNIDLFPPRIWDMNAEQNKPQPAPQESAPAESSDSKPSPSDLPAGFEEVPASPEQ